MTSLHFRSLLLASLSPLALAAPALAQDAPAQPTARPATPPRPAVEPDGQDAIIVTGTRRIDRTVADSPVPIDVISSDALTNTGLTEVNKVLNQLVPSFNFPQPSIADGTDVLRPATLRGLSPDQTLVLVNGKRRHVSALLNINGTIGRGSAAVDLNLIPTLAIERIEVLRDGASSQYGSDAIAGVINVRLKRADHGGRATASYGKYITRLDDVRGFNGLQTNGAGQPILDPADPRYFLANGAGERKARDGAITTIGANIGLPVGGGFVNLTAEYRDRNATNRAGFDLRPNYVPSNGVPAFDPRELTFNRLQFKFGDAKTEDFNFFLNAGVPIGDFEVYAFGSYGKRDGLSAANYRSANAAANRDFSVLAPNTPPTNANFVGLTPDGFLPLIDTDLQDWAGTAGVRGDVMGWKGDLSAGYGHNQFDYTIRDSLNTSFGPAAKRVVDAGGLEFNQFLINLDFSREFAVGLAEPLSVAVGAEYRNENFQIRPGELESFGTGPFFRAAIPGSNAVACTAAGGLLNASNTCTFPGRAAPDRTQGFPGFPTASETDESRHSFAGYVELDGELFEGLTAQLAGRYERFSDFGSTVNGKLAMRYQVADGYAVRGSVSNGFRAPSLHQQFFSTTSTNFLAGVPVESSTFPVSDPVAQALGATELKPEKSVNFSVGATANPFRGLNLTIDYYNIKINDRIVLTENLGPSGSGTAAQRAAIQAILNANGFPNIGAARFFINGLDTTTKGLDVIGTYRFDAGAIGKWILTAALNINKTKIDKRINALGPLATIPDLVLFGRVEGIRLTDGQPKDKVVLSADGDIGNFGITARTTRYGKSVALENTPPAAPNAASLDTLGPDDQTLSPKWITDLEIRHRYFDRFDLAIGANNIFDVYPDRRPFGPRPGGGFYPQNFQYIPYSGGASPYGFNGRFIYVRAGIDF